METTTTTHHVTISLDPIVLKQSVKSMISSNLFSDVLNMKLEGHITKDCYPYLFSTHSTASKPNEQKALIRKSFDGKSVIPMNQAALANNLALLKELKALGYHYSPFDLLSIAVSKKNMDMAKWVNENCQAEMWFIPGTNNSASAFGEMEMVLVEKKLFEKMGDKTNGQFQEDVRICTMDKIASVDK